MDEESFVLFYHKTINKSRVQYFFNGSTGGGAVVVTGHPHLSPSL